MTKHVEIKTKPTESSVTEFIKNIADDQKRKDSLVILGIMENAMNVKPRMWGTSMIGFGEKRYKSPATGREVDWFIMGFSPRKANLSLHLINLQNHTELLEKLGKHKTGVGCLYINKLAEIDIQVLREITENSASINS